MLTPEQDAYLVVAGARRVSVPPHGGRAARSSVEKMRGGGRRRRPRSRPSRTHYRAARARARPGCCPSRRSSRSRSLPDADELPEPRRGGRATSLDRAVVLKLNGGLGHEHGHDAGRSRCSRSRTAAPSSTSSPRQVLALRERYGARLPLVLMNSFATRDDSLAALAPLRRACAADVPLDFLQSKEPKLRADDLRPVSWPADPELEWCPPGHGDLYPRSRPPGCSTPLLERGLPLRLRVQRRQPRRDRSTPRILAWIAREERAVRSWRSRDRTEADRKGGHLARARPTAGLVLRETAQTPDERPGLVPGHRAATASSTRTTSGSTCARSGCVLADRGGVLGPADDRQPQDRRPAPTRRRTPVIQLETAMGAAIGVVRRARGALHVPRSRFAPGQDDQRPARRCAPTPTCWRDDARRGARPAAGPARRWSSSTTDHFKLIADFDARFAGGPPSLVELRPRHGRGATSSSARAWCAAGP